MSRHFKLTATLICLTMVIVSLLAGCNGNTNSTGAKKGKVTIEWSVWGNPGENVRFEQFNAAFNKKHAADINLKYTPIPSDGYSQKILSSLAAGTAPDVFYLGDDIITYINENRLMDLAPMMKASTDIRPTDYALNIFGNGIQGGKIYGIVPDCNPEVIYYNADMIKALGEKTPQDYVDEGQWTWANFSNLCKKTAVSGKMGLVFDNTWAAYDLVLGNLGNGLVFNDDGTKVDLDTPAKAAGVQSLYDLWKSKAITCTVQLSKGQDGSSLFASQQCAMTISGRWSVPVFKDIKNFKWDIAPFPKSPSGAEVKSYVAIAYVSMNKATKHPKEAFTFMDEFLNKEGTTYRLSGGGNALPSLKDPSLASLVNDGIVGHSQYFIQGRDNGLGTPKGGQDSPEATQAITDTFAQMFLGKIDAATCVKNCVEKGNAALAKLK